MTKYLEKKVKCQLEVLLEVLLLLLCCLLPLPLGACDLVMARMYPTTGEYVIRWGKAHKLSAEERTPPHEMGGYRSKQLEALAARALQNIGTDEKNRRYIMSAAGAVVSVALGGFLFKSGEHAAPPHTQFTSLTGASRWRRLLMSIPIGFSVAFGMSANAGPDTTA